MRGAVRAIAVAILVPAGSSTAEDWPEWRGPRRDGVFRESGWLSGWPPGREPRVSWRARVGKGHSAVSVSEGSAFTVGWDGKEACRLGDERLVNELLARRPGLTRALPDDTRRKLVDQTQDENLTAVRLMLAAGWPPDARGQENGTALHWAAFLGNAAIVRDLLRAGAPIDVKGDAHDSTPLGWAIHGSVHSWTRKTGDHVGVVKALLDAGARPPAQVKDASAPVRELLKPRAGERS